MDDNFTGTMPRGIYFKNSLSSSTALLCTPSKDRFFISLQETPLKNSHFEVFLQQHGSLERCSSVSP